MIEKLFIDTWGWIVILNKMVVMKELGLKSVLTNDDHFIHVDIIPQYQYISSAFELITQVTTSFAVSKPNAH